MLILKILKEYIRRIVRNYKIYIVSILGMGIAIIASFYIYFFAYKEISTDAFHTKGKDIYRLVNKAGDANFRSTETFLPLGELLTSKLPEVTDYVRIMPEFPLELYSKGETVINNFSLIDPSFFKIFDFRLKSGSVKNFKATPNGIIISEKVTTILFKNENPIGKIIRVSSYNNQKKIELQVVGVMDEIPKTSTIQGDYFVNISSYNSFQRPDFKEMEWFARDTELYLFIPNLQDKKALSNKITTTLLPKIKSSTNLAVMAVPEEDIKEIDYEFDLQRMDHVYFDSMDIPNQEKKGDFQMVRILILVGLLTLFMATTNYVIMNLGLNMNRAKEFKVRRYLGASKFNVFTQLMAESLCNALLCFAITLISYPFLGGFLGSLIGFEYQLSFVSDISLLFGYLGIVLLVGLIIGILEYALSYRTIFVDHKHKGINTGNSWKTKKTMIGFQLTLFIGLMCCILFVGKQINYMQNIDFGYNIKNVISVSSAVKKDLKNYLKAKSYVKEVSKGQALYKTKFRLDEILLENKEAVNVIMIEGDDNYLKVHGIKLLEGENLKLASTPSKSIVNDNNHYVKFYDVLVNEEFVRKANLKNPIGTVLTRGEIKKFVIVGVFKNVYNSPLYNSVQPIVIGSDLLQYTNVFQVACEEAYKTELISDLMNSDEMQKIPMKYRERFVSSYDYKDIYKKELQLKNLLEAFTIIILFISMLGMVAISLFIAESKTKEIGIRKVNGATVWEILSMLNKDYIKWIAIAFSIAAPVVWYIMGSWLENFAYKTTLSWWVFALAGGITLLSALLTVSWQSIRAARASPIKSLRTE